MRTYVSKLASPLVPVVLSLVIATGCKDDPPGTKAGVCEGACKLTGDCAGGSLCSAGQCAKLCNVGSDCEDCADQICVEGKCTAETGGAPPLIEEVRGNDLSDPQQVLDGMIVTGQLFEQAAFELRDDAGAVLEGLQVRAQSRFEAELVFPADVRSGNYTLIVSNQAGSDQAPVQLTLPELTGDLLISRINTATVEIVDVGVLPVGTDAQSVAAGDHPHTGEYVQVSGDTITGDLAVMGNVGIGAAAGAAKLTVNGTFTNPTQLSGLVSVLSADLATLHGDADTRFTVELRDGDAISIGGTTYTATVITDDQTLTIDPLALTGFTDQVATISAGPLLRVENSAGAPLLNVNRWGEVGVGGPAREGTPLRVNGTVSSSVIGVFCGASATQYDGELDFSNIGYPTAKAICETTCGDSNAHMCMAHEIGISAQLGLLADLTDDLWYSTGMHSVDGTININDCRGWTNNNGFGTVWNVGSFGGDRPAARDCGDMYFIACCR